jgi:hypothetical protein
MMNFITDKYLFLFTLWYTNTENKLYDNALIQIKHVTKKEIHKALCWKCRSMTGGYQLTRINKVIRMYNNTIALLSTVHTIFSINNIIYCLICSHYWIDNTGRMGIYYMGLLFSNIFFSRRWVFHLKKNVLNYRK